MVSVKSVRRIGAASLIVPVIDHLTAPTLTMIFAPQMMAVVFGPGAVAATLFFIILGLFQAACIELILKSNNVPLLVLGVLGNLVSILIYFISVSGVTILGVTPQPLIPFAVLIKAFEAIFILSSIYVMKARPQASR